MTSCGSDEATTWTCEIGREKGYRGWIVWNPSRSLDFQIPSDWQAREARSLSGTIQKLAKDQIVQVRQTPILIDNVAQ